ncbi:MAG: sialidase family protein [Gemmatimonadota bacterium]
MSTTRIAALLGLAAAAACSSASGDTPPATLAERGAGRPTVAADARTGGAYVAWVADSAGTPGVYLARVAPDGAPGAPTRVNDLAGDASTHDQAPPQVALGPRGEVYVAWQRSTPVPGRPFPASDLRFARSEDGGRTWAPAVTVNDDAGGPPSSHTFHNLAVAPDGAVYVSWIDSRERDRVRVERIVAGVPKPAPADGHGHGGHAAAEAGLPGPEIRVARSTDGGRSWGRSVVVDADACPCCRTALAVGPDGAVYVAWRKVFPGDVRDVVVARRAPGEMRFSAPVRVHEDGWVFPGCPHAGPSLAVDGTGRVHVAWYTGREGRQGLWHASADAAVLRFGEPRALLTGGWVPPSQARVAADADGAWIAWEDRREQEAKLLLGRVDGAGRPRVADRDAARGKLPDLASAGGGRVLAWEDGGAVRVRRAGR